MTNETRNVVKLTPHEKTAMRRAMEKRGYNPARDFQRLARDLVMGWVSDPSKHNPFESCSADEVRFLEQALAARRKHGAEAQTVIERILLNLS